MIMGCFSLDKHLSILHGTALITTFPGGCGRAQNGFLGDFQGGQKLIKLQLESDGIVAVNILKKYSSSGTYSPGLYWLLRNVSS